MTPTETLLQEKSVKEGIYGKSGVDGEGYITTRKTFYA